MYTAQREPQEDLRYFANQTPTLCQAKIRSTQIEIRKNRTSSNTVTYERIAAMWVKMQGFNTADLLLHGPENFKSCGVGKDPS